MRPRSDCDMLFEDGLDNKRMLCAERPEFETLLSTANLVFGFCYGGICRHKQC